MKHNFHGKKGVTLLLALALVLTMTIGGTMAFLFTESNTVTNSFQAGNVTCAVDANAQKVQNTGDVKAYIRVAVVANWADKTNASIVHSAPIEPTVNNGAWKPVTTNNVTYYYYEKAVDPDDFTSALTISLTGENPDSNTYEANVQILAEAIQVGGGAAYHAWGVDLYGTNG